MKSTNTEKANHTAGPWHAGREHISDDIEIRQRDKRGRTVAVVPMQVKCDDPESCANARLIAAAPELLEACKKAKVIIESDESSFTPSVRASVLEVLGEINEVIAAAEGA